MIFLIHHWQYFTWNHCHNFKVTGEVEEEADTGVTYFVDEEGRYYYQPAGDNQNIVSLQPEVTQDNDGEVKLNHILFYAKHSIYITKLLFCWKITEDAQMLVDGESYQTVTLVPSDTGNGEVSYVLVMQEENKPVVNLNIKVDQVIFYDDWRKEFPLNNLYHLLRFGWQ